MVDKKISELPEVTSVGSGDVVPVVVDDNGLITSKVSFSNLLGSSVDNKKIALDDNQKLTLGEETYNMFGELILKNLINSYENNLSDLTYDFAQADSFHIENGINNTVNTTTDLYYTLDYYENFRFEQYTKSNSSKVGLGNSEETVNAKFLVKGYISQFTITKTQGAPTYTITIKDNSGNVLASKSKEYTGQYTNIDFSFLDYSRLINVNEDITITIDTTDTTERHNLISTTKIEFNNSSYIESMIINEQVPSNATLNASVSDVSDTDSVALFIDSDNADLITPTYNTSAGQLQSIDFDFSDTEIIEFYGYVLYVYK